MQIITLSAGAVGRRHSYGHVSLSVCTKPTRQPSDLNSLARDWLRSRRKCWFVVAGGTEENRDRDLNSRLHEETAGAGALQYSALYPYSAVREQAPRISKSQICQGFDSDYTHIALHILGLEETWQCLCKLRTGAHSLSNNTL